MILARDSNASPPTRYEAAKLALAECLRVDECKDWVDKAATLQYWAQQRDDKELIDYAKRIHARAVRRCGELLKEIAPDDNGGGRRWRKRELTPSRTQAAADAGLSVHQKREALRVANVPCKDFEKAVDEDKQSARQIAKRGRRKAKPSKRKTSRIMTASQERVHQFIPLFVEWAERPRVYVKEMDERFAALGGRRPDNTRTLCIACAYHVPWLRIIKGKDDAGVWFQFMVDAELKAVCERARALPELDGWSAERLLMFLRDMRAEIARKRKDAHAERRRRNWNLNAVITKELEVLLRWIEDQLETLPNPPTPGTQVGGKKQGEGAAPASMQGDVESLTGEKYVH
jgi:hypothetical protein